MTHDDPPWSLDTHLALETLGRGDQGPGDVSRCHNVSQGSGHCRVSGSGSDVVLPASAGRVRDPV